MSGIRDLHRQAMDLAEAAFVAKISGDPTKEGELTRQAYEFEKRAVRLVSRMSAPEPTRSIIHRSAASLAIDCAELRDAERLIASALAGDPPDEIAEELRDLLEQVNFRRHLDLKGISLVSDELQLSIAGKGVGHGIVQSIELVDRLQKVQRLIIRTMERQANVPYRDSGGLSKSVRDYQVFVSVPRAASIAVSLKIGKPAQSALPGMEYGADVIGDILDCLELLNREEEEELRAKIPEPAYYRNFIGLARSMAPDGKDVALVGFTSVRNKVERRVELTRHQDAISIPPDVASGPLVQHSSNPVTVQGRLLFADATDASSESIKLVDEKGKRHSIIVPEGMMSDIVRPLWEDDVIVKGFRTKTRGGKIRLEDIKKAE